jgi:hypothetical protein
VFKYIYLFIFLISLSFGFAQNGSTDNKYLEDQIYLGIFYNTLNDVPNELNQNKFSSSFNLGFIRDLPLNENRNFGLGIGLGLSRSSYNNNLIFSKGNTDLKINFNSDLDSFEIRWRTSTPTNYRFWRVYFGLKTSYILSSKYKFESDSTKLSLSSLPFNEFQYGFTLNAGNNTWNLGLYLGLNPLFDDQFVKKYESIKNIKQFKIGLVFYIL